MLLNKIKNLRQFIVQKTLESSSSEERAYFALTLVTGVLSALVAVGFYYSVKKIKIALGTNSSFSGSAILFGGISILISGYLTTRKFPKTEGSGIPGVRISLAVFHGHLGLKDTAAKLITSVLSLASGFSLGREGPTAAISAGIGSSLGRFFHLSKKRVKALVAVGTAGGISAAFNTPIAAVVFTLEEVVGDLNAKMLGSIIISSVAASVVAQSFLGDSSYLTQLHYKLNNPNEIIFYIITGILSAFLGVAWVKSVTWYRKKSLGLLKGHRLTLIMITFVAIAGISHVAPQAIGDGHRSITEAIQAIILDWKILLLIFGFKFIATTICYGCGVSGGLFMPTLLMGATLGGLVGAIAQMIFPEIAPNVGAFALVGMGAYFAAVIRAPITSILMVFELTRDYNIVLPLMIANIVAYFIAEKVHEGSIYENISEQDGIHLPSKNDQEVLDSLHVEDAMVTDVKALNCDDIVSETATKLPKNKISGFPVTRENKLLGMISTSEIFSASTSEEKKSMSLGELCMKKVIRIYPDQSLFMALHLLDKFHVSRLPVVSRLDDKEIIGIITADDVVKKFGYVVTESKSTP